MQIFRCWSSYVLSSLALCCLASAMNRFLDEERYGSIMERMPVLYDEWALTKRDVCADAIPGTITSFCTPGKTLCCTPNNTNSAYPQCQSFLGSGFCCVSANNCYIDTNSDCAASNSISCPLLAEGVTEACCPPFTICPGNFNQSSTVRCNVAQGAALASSSSTSIATSTSTIQSTQSSTSSTTSSSIPTSSSTPTSATISSSGTISPMSTGTPATSSQSSSLSPGADAGIGIAGAFAVLAVAGIAFWAYRRRNNKRTGAQAAQQTADPGYQGYYHPNANEPAMQQPEKYNSRYELSAPQQNMRPAELSTPQMNGNVRPAELGSY